MDGGEQEGALVVRQGWGQRVGGALRDESWEKRGGAEKNVRGEIGRNLVGGGE